MSVMGKRCYICFLFVAFLVFQVTGLNTSKAINSPEKMKTQGNNKDIRIDNLKVKDITEDSALLVWKLSDIEAYGYNIKMTVELMREHHTESITYKSGCKPADMYCQLDGLAPDSAYSVKVYLADESQSYTAVETIFTTDKEGFKYTLVYIVAPSAVGLILLVLIVIAVICVCKRQRRYGHETKTKKRSRSPVNEWIQDTCGGIELDPPSHSYDHLLDVQPPSASAVRTLTIQRPPMSSSNTEVTYANTGTLMSAPRNTNAGTRGLVNVNNELKTMHEKQRKGNNRQNNNCATPGSSSLPSDHYVNTKNGLFPGKTVQEKMLPFL